MDGIREKIRSRGHWLFRFRPATFDPERLAYESLEETIRGVVVRFRGWDVPHIEDLVHGGDWVGSESQFHHHLEAWRFFTSGQLIDLVAFGSDWSDESALERPRSDWRPGQITPVWESLFRFTEFFELAARLALRLPGEDPVVVEIETRGLEGRALVVGDRSRAEFFEPRIAQIDSFPFRAEYSREELAASAREQAVRAARELFLRFGWTSSTEKALADYQLVLTKEG